MNYCQQCGHRLEENQTFCTNCGAKVVESQNAVQSQNVMKAGEGSGSRRPVLATKKSKIFASIGVLLILVIASSFFIVKSVYKPTKLAENFILAVNNHDAKKVAHLLNSKQSDIKIDEKVAKQLIDYYQMNPSEFSELKNSLHEEAVIYEKGAFPEHTDADISINKLGKKWLFFDYYALIPKNLYIVVTANHDSHIYIDGKKYEPIKKDEERTYGPFLPINHKVQAVYKGEYADVKQVEEVSPSDAEENKVYINFDLTGDYVYLYSNIEDATLFVNGKSTGLKISDVEEFGPVATDGSMTLHAEIKTADGTVKSNKKTIKEAGETIDLLFEQEIPMEDFEDVGDSLKDYHDEQSEIENVIMSHYTSISSGDYETAYAMFSSSRRSKISYEKWSKGLKNNFKNEVTNVSVESIENDQATVSFQLTSYDKQDDGSTLVQEWGGKWYLVKESDGWKLATPEIKKLNTRTE